MFDIKQNGKGKTERYSARFVAKALSQIPVTDLQEVISFEKKNITISLIFSFAALFAWKRFLNDVNNTFSNAVLNEEV